MPGLQTQKAPSPGLVLPHYALGAIFFLATCVLLLFSSNAFSGHYFHPKLLALTHMAALGWATMIIFGALYQLLPVILEAPLYSEKLAKVTLVFFSAGVICLVYSFWNFYVGLTIQVASLLILLSFFLFAINIIVTACKALKWNNETDFIITSCIWLLLTGILGTMMAFNFSYPFLEKSHLLFLKIHAHTGIAGWFMLLIMGVGSKLIPMFLLSHNLNTKKLNYTYYLLNLGLIGFTIDLFLRDEKALLPLYALLIISGLLFFISFIFEAYKKRARKLLDIGLKHSFAAFVFILLPILIGIIISFNPSLRSDFLQQVYLVYGTTVFLGFISSLILGQTFKTLPFIVWLSVYSHSPGKQKNILPKNLYNDKILNTQYVVYILSILTLIAGILLAQPVVIKAGAVLLLITAFLYNINVFKTLRHFIKPANI